MTNLPPDLEALMPEPAGFRTRHRSEPGMLGHYPWDYSDPRRRLFDRPNSEYEDLFTADQVRAAILEATERAAKVCEERSTAYRTTRAPGWHEVDHECTQCAAAIRGDGGGA